MSHQKVDVEKLLHCYSEYMNFVVDNPPTIKQLLLNIDEKLSDDEFLNDIQAILRLNVVYDNITAWKFLKQATRFYRLYQ